MNSPIEAPALVERAKNDWGNADAETLRQSLLKDIRGPKVITREGYTDRFVNPALERLRFYFPETYKTLEGNDLKRRKEFEKQATDARR